MANVGMYREIKTALQSQITSYLTSQAEQVDVYRVPYQNIPLFPAVAMETKERRKAKKGLGVRELQFDMDIWVYVDILDVEDAEDECMRLLEIVEDAIESDKTLDGAVHYLSIDSSAEFGTVQSGEASFLQGAKLSVTLTKRFQ